MMSCEHATRLASERQERPLTLRENTELKMHLIICSGCREFSRQMDALRSLIRDQPTDQPESDGDDTPPKP